MKTFFTVFLLICTAPLFSQTRYISTAAVSPLASYSPVWNDIKYSNCNTAVNTSWLNSDEKDIIYILNLVRAHPTFFARSVLKNYPSLSGKGYLAEDSFYFISLVKTLEKMEPMNIVYPDKDCFESAKCHAYNSGITGYVGHERKTTACKTRKHYYGECADYGHSDPLEIVLSLLIDEGIPSLGHRLVCLSSYAKIGVSIQPHSRYGSNAVLDFYY
ncbi:MAG: hypothetical protein ABIO79_17465 [Ferruginibacter sp.]